MLDVLNILANENKLVNCTIAGLASKNELRSRLNNRANQSTMIVGILSLESLLDSQEVPKFSQMIIKPYILMFQKKMKWWQLGGLTSYLLTAMVLLQTTQDQMPPNAQVSAPFLKIPIIDQQYK